VSVAALLALATLAVACAGGTQPQSKPTSPTAVPASPSGASGNPRLSPAKYAYAACMRQYGVPMQDPDENADLTFDGVVDGVKFQAAQSACGPGWPPSSRWSIVQILRAQDYVTMQRQCLTQHGIRLQDKGNPWALQSAAGPGDPSVRAAIQLCNQQLGPPIMIKQPDAPSN
jgi:hypothetical protein